MIKNIIIKCITEKRKSLSILSGMTLLILSILTILSPAVLTGCSLKKEPISQSGFYFDTIISVTLYDSAQQEYLDGCFALADRYESYFSATIADSDVSKINAAQGNGVTVHEETAELIRQGLAYSDISDGKFDITIGALSDLWDFSNNTGIVPSDEEIEATLDTVGYEQVTVSGNTVTLSDPDTKIDLGGIAKGYIADAMKSYLNENGVTEGIINLGGNVLTVGEKSSGETYTIGLQKPFSEDGTAIASVEISDASVVSSGVYQRYFYLNDKLYHHILDPGTGYPVENNLLGVTIISKSSMDGDSLSTTCFSLGLEKGMELIESLEDTEAIFITDDYELHGTSGIGTGYPLHRLD